eukprot:4786637-Pyramimonas_sp.AAC.1
MAILSASRRRAGGPDIVTNDLYEAAPEVSSPPARGPRAQTSPQVLAQKHYVEVASVLRGVDQRGGRPGRGTAGASFQVRVFQDFVCRQGYSAVLYFTDLRAAFHSRQGVFS